MSIHPFPRTPLLRVIEQSPAGRHFPPVDITPGLDGCRVWLNGVLYATGLTLSNAARAASALQVLVDLGCEPETPTLARMLEASVATIPTPEKAP